MSARPGAKLALPEPACHETTYCSGFHLFGFLAYAVLLCGRFFGFDDEKGSSTPIPWRNINFGGGGPRLGSLFKIWCE
jgi:hypothetical protein